MEYRKYIYLVTVFLILCGCTDINLGPEQVLLKYLNAVDNNNHREAHGYLSSKDKPFDTFTDEIAEERNKFISLLYNKTAFKIESVNVTGNTATIKVKFTSPDLLKITENKLYVAFSEGKLKDKDIPMKTGSVVYSLIMEGNEWKVFLDLKSQREKEKAQKIEKASYIKDKIKIENINIFESSSHFIIEGEIKNIGNHNVVHIETLIYLLDKKGLPIDEEVDYPISEFSSDPSKKSLKPNYIRKFRTQIYNAPSEWAKKVDIKIINIFFQNEVDVQ